MSDEFQARMIVRLLKDSIRSSPLVRWALRGERDETPAEKQEMDDHEASVRATIAYWEAMLRKGGPDLRAALDHYNRAMDRDRDDRVIAHADEIKAARASESWH